jgi:hypothetical protein
MKKIFSVFLLFATSVFAAPKICSDKELRNRNCLVQLDKIKISVRDQSLFLFDNKKIQIVDNPFASPSALWKEANIRKISSYIVFEFIGWDVPGSDGGQSLVYTAYGVSNAKMKLIIRDVIQRRHFDWQSKQYIYTAKDSYKLELNDHKKLVYTKGKKRQALLFPQ